MLAFTKDASLSWLFLKEYSCPYTLWPPGDSLELNIGICSFSLIFCLAPGRKLSNFTSAPNPTYISQPGDYWEPLGAQKFGSGPVLQAIISLWLTRLATVILILSARSHRTKFCLNNVTVYSSIKLKPRLGTEKIVLRANRSPNRKEILQPEPRLISPGNSPVPVLLLTRISVGSEGGEMCSKLVRIFVNSEILFFGWLFHGLSSEWHE